MQNSSDPVPAIVEREATGEILDIFQDIKEITGADVVNLVWRHLAITPGALQNLWKMLRPIYASGAVLAEAKQFRCNLKLPELPTISENALRACGVDKLGQRNIKNILNSYNRTNSINLIGLSAALAYLNKDEGIQTANLISTSEEPLLPLPPLPPISDLDHHIRQLVGCLNDICEEDGTIVASMYRHLAYWPGYLGLVYTALSPYSSDGNMKCIINLVRSEARSIGARLSSQLEPLESTVSKETVEIIRSVLMLFIKHPLSKMAVICGALSLATPAVK